MLVMCGFFDGAIFGKTPEFRVSRKIRFLSTVSRIYVLLFLFRFIGRIEYIGNTLDKIGPVYRKSLTKVFELLQELVTILQYEMIPKTKTRESDTYIGS